VSEAAVIHAEANESPLTPESWGKLGMWVFLVGDAMSFGTLLAGYGAVRYGSVDWPIPANILGINLTAFMTFLLIVSSVTMVKGLAAIQRNDLAGFRKFIGLTILGGVIFLGCQAYEWNHLIHGGMGFTGWTWHTKTGEVLTGASLFSTTFFIITGFHGMHVTGGVIYLLCILLRGMSGAYSATNYNPVEILGLYWHFVDLVWIMVFTFVYLL
jgi:heme/copper-type cytochrome/quinol oxidase subunit 3